MLMLTLFSSVAIVFFSVGMLTLALKNKERRQKLKGTASSCASGCSACSCNVQSDNHCQEK